MKTDERWASFRDAVVSTPGVDAHLEAVRQRAVATLIGRPARAPSAAAMLLQDPEAEAFLAGACPIIWREGRRRKHRAQMRAVALLAAAAALVWMAVVMLPPTTPTTMPAAQHWQSDPAPTPTPPGHAVAATTFLQRVRTPPTVETPDGSPLIVRTGDVDTRIDFIAQDQIFDSLQDFTVALVGTAGNNPRLYLQSPGSETFVPVN